MKFSYKNFIAIGFLIALNGSFLACEKGKANKIVIFKSEGDQSAALNTEVASRLTEEDRQIRTAESKREDLTKSRYVSSEYSPEVPTNYPAEAAHLRNGLSQTTEQDQKVEKLYSELKKTNSTEHISGASAFSSPTPSAHVSSNANEELISLPASSTSATLQASFNMQKKDGKSSTSFSLKFKGSLYIRNILIALLIADTTQASARTFLTSKGREELRNTEGIIGKLSLIPDKMVTVNLARKIASMLRLRR